MQAAIFLLDILVAFPSAWGDLLNKSITLLWPLIFTVTWLISMNFPFKYAYFLPLVLVSVNSTTLWYWMSRATDADENTPDKVPLLYIYCSMG